MPGLTGKLTQPNKLTPAERGVRSGIASNIARRGAATVNKGIRAAVSADALERESLLTQFEVAGQDLPEGLLEQLDLRSELRRETATFEAAEGPIAAQYTKQFDPITMAENSRILDSNINNLTRSVTSQDAKIERKGKLVDLAQGLATLQQTNVKTEGAELDNALKQFDVNEVEITQRMDQRFGGASTADIYSMIGDGRMAAMNVPLARAHRYAATRRKQDIDLQVAEFGFRKARAGAQSAEAKLRTGKLTAAKAQKQQLLLGMNTEELSALSRQVRSSGSFVANGVTFNQVDVAEALDTVQASGLKTRELKLAGFQNDIAADALITDMNEVGTMMNAVYGGGGEGYAEMTMDDLAEQQAGLEARAALEMPDDTVGQQSLVTEQMSLYVAEMGGKVADLRKAAIARTPENARPALIDVTQRGYIIDSGTAIRAMEENMSAFATMEKSSFYSGAGRVMFNAVTQPAVAGTGENDAMQALLGGKKDKSKKFNADAIASSLTDATVERNIVDSVSGRIAQAGAISAYSFAAEVLDNDQSGEVANYLFDQGKTGLKQSFLLQERPEQINWATAIPELADVVYATSTLGSEEEKLDQLQSFFTLFENGYVASETVQQVTGRAKPQTLPEHQVWANARLVNDAIMPFKSQVGNMLQNEAADLSTQTTLVIEEYKQRLATQDDQRDTARIRNARGGARPNLGAGNSGNLGFKRAIKSDEQFASERLDRLAAERAATARALETE